MGTTNKTACDTAATGVAGEMDCSKGDLMGHGAPSWIELCTSDVAAAQKFYGALFGWSTEAFTGGGMPYQMILVNGQPRGGMYDPGQECQPTPPTHWCNVIAVNDVDAVAKQAEALGGKVLMPPFDIPTIGRYTTIQDPQGAVISAITYLKK